MQGIQAGIFDTRISRCSERQSAPRVVRQYELEFFLDSEGVSVVNGIDHQIEVSNILVVKPGQTRYSIFPFKCYYLYLPAEHKLASYLNSVPTTIKTKQLPVYRKLFSSIVSDFYSPLEGSELLVEANILRLVYHICASNSHLPYLEDNYIIQQATKFIDDNYQSPICLKDIAKAVNLSPTYFRELFTSILRISPHQYLLEKRLRMAKNILMVDDLPIVDVAYMCGFSSQSYFNYVFKKETGLTPSQFKKQIHENYII